MPLEIEFEDVYIYADLYTRAAMRTNIDIDDELMAQAMKATGQRTKKATVEAALRKAVMLSGQKEAFENLWGIGWEGDLDEMRTDWSPDVDWALQRDKK